MFLIGTFTLVTQVAAQSSHSMMVLVRDRSRNTPLVVALVQLSEGR